ncbi:GNAT family N-acetyltransferase [Paenibacillus sp. NPDC057934]|uniref:GNAT family N-acetyltransferase n=1 Tax=Paenibacillus sp. NPDC057934 TaxID=3346282 RepID=UPI0036DD1308
MIYRAMTADDYAAAYELWVNTEGMGLNEADSREGILCFLERNPGLSQVCVHEDGSLVGTALCGHDGRRGFLYHVAVSHVSRGKGAGHELVARCLDKLRDNGIAKCHLMVIKENQKGRQFWEELGWQYRDDIALYSRDI